MSSKIVWRPEYCIGIPEMDAQHQAIFEALLAVEKSVSSKDAKRTTAYYLKQLRENLAQHLLDEEGLLRTAKFTKLKEHVTQHEELMAGLKELEAGLRQESKAEHLLELFEAWFVRHVLGHDTEYAAYLTNAGAPLYVAWKRTRGSQTS